METSPKLDTKILALVSAKGGAGKTLAGASLASFASKLGKRILLIDCDASTNGLTLFYLEKVVKGYGKGGSSKLKGVGIFDPQVGLKENTTPFSLSKNVDMIPATYQMKQTEETSPEEFSKAIAKTIELNRGKYNYIFLDSQAGTDFFAQAAIDVSDEIIIVSEYDPPSIKGIERLKHLFYSSLQDKKVWVLFNKILPEFTSKFSDFFEISNHLPPIPWDAEVVKEFAKGKILADSDEIYAHTLAISRILKSLFDYELEEEIEQFLSGKEAKIKNPINDELEYVEKELETAQVSKQYLKKRKIRGWFIAAGFVLALSSFVFLTLSRQEMQKMQAMQRIQEIKAMQAMQRMPEIKAMIKERQRMVMEMKEIIEERPEILKERPRMVMEMQGMIKEMQAMQEMQEMQAMQAMQEIQAMQRVDKESFSPETLVVYFLSIIAVCLGFLYFWVLKSQGLDLKAMQSNDLLEELKDRRKVLMALKDSDLGSFLGGKK